MEKTRGNKYKVHWQKFHTDIRNIFYIKNNHSLEQPPQECGGVHINEGFQYVIGQGAR